MDNDDLESLVPCLGERNHNFTEVNQTTSAAIHHVRLFLVFAIFRDDLGYLVKPRSTMWFSRFLLEQYDNDRWLTNFRMTKRAVFILAEILKPHVQKQDTCYKLVIPVIIHIACTLFKLAPGASLLICSEMFVVGTSTVSKMLRETVHTINDVLGHEIALLVSIKF